MVEHWSPKPGVGSSSLSTRALKMITIINYIKNSYEELRNNVSWTPRGELQDLVLVVLVFSIIFSLAIWGADTILSRIVKIYLNIING